MVEGRRARWGRRGCDGHDLLARECGACSDFNRREPPSCPALGGLGRFGLVEDEGYDVINLCAGVSLI
jgi:hypothetical protein